MISGLQKPSSGKIFFGDDDVTELSTENRGIGLVFQNYALYPHMTVKQNILFPLQNLKGADKMTKAQMDERAQWAAGLVQIGKYLAGRGFTSIERLTVNTTTSVGTSGNTVQQQASYKVNLTDGEVVYLTLTYYTSDATEGFITFQLVLGAV
jgi:ABC-type branched-subunit amino acid transport system ATPase component